MVKAGGDRFKSGRQIPSRMDMSGRGAGTFKLQVMLGGGQNRT